jgi:aminoglycoside N3'-acetyltransferase
MGLEIQIILYDLIRKIFPQKTRNKFKHWLRFLKNYSRPLILLIYKTLDDDEIFEHIKNKLEAEPDFEILMIHSSYENMKPVYNGNINNFLKKLIGYCNQKNITLAMPAFTFFENNQKTIDYYNKHFFDVKKSISKMGLITEIFRRTENVKRSIHPTHSICAYGPLAEEMTCNHHLADTTFGKGTPFGFMAEHKTKILGIGVKYYRVLTQIHTAENMVEQKAHLKSELLKQINVTCVYNKYHTFLYNYKFNCKVPARSANQIKKILNRNITEWKFRNINLFMTEAKSTTDLLMKAFENGITIYS